MPALSVANGDRLTVLRERIRTAPTEPGVYRWLDRDGDILYVGKAKNLRNRLKSYVTGSPQRDAGVFKRSMWDKMWELDLTVTNTELEALILEMNLIHKIKPPYNVAMKRDRSYCFVRVGANEDFPSVRIVQKRAVDGARYFGPFLNRRGQEQMIDLLRTVYPFRTCTMGISMAEPELFPVREVGKRLELEVTLKKPDRRAPCLDYHIQRCSGPCAGSITKQDYADKSIHGVIEFYEGKFAPVIDRLIERMQAAATGRKFERAMEIRDALRFVKGLQRQHQLFRFTDVYADAVACALYGETLHIVLLQVRGGNVVNEMAVSLEQSEKIEEMLTDFLTQYYAQESAVPDRIFIDRDLPDVSVLKQYLRSLRSSAVSIDVPQKGEGAKLIKLARKNVEKKIEMERKRRDEEVVQGVERLVPAMG